MKELVALRRQRGPTSPIGHRCTNLLERIEYYSKETNRDARKNILEGIEEQKAQLAKLLESPDDAR